MLTLHRPIVVDTETYYDENGCSIKAKKPIEWDGGNWHYTHHRDFYCYMLTWEDIATGESGVIDTLEGMRAFARTELPGRTIIAHNAGFDVAVLKQMCHEFVAFNTFDTADMASYLQVGRSLDQAAEYLLGIKVDKGMRAFMSGKHYRDLPAEEQRKMREYALTDAHTTAQLFRKHSASMPPIEQWMSNFTREQNEAGVHIDAEYLTEQIERVQATRSRAEAGIPWAENYKPLSPKQLALYCREVGILPPTSLAEDSEECQAWENQYGPTFPVVAAMRDYRKSNIYYRKLQLIQRLLRPDGTIPLSTKYAAAPHTLRFSAAQFNYQSLPKPDAKDANGDVTEYSYADLRGCLIPSPGTVFAGSDLSGIEARCLPWLAEDYPYLEEVARLDRQAEAAGLSGGGDIYEPAARKMFDYSDPRPLKRTDKNLRNATKVCVLQLGYQSGAAKFLSYIYNNVGIDTMNRVRKTNPSTGQPESDAALATRLVTLYRATNPKVTGLWKAVDNDLRSAQMVGAPLTVQQPNGRQVLYRNLMVRETTKSDGKVWQEIVGLKCLGEPAAALYGGKITENICQEMARHVLVWSIYNLTQAGYRVRMSIHDENVCEVPRERATPETARDIERIMSLTPAWAPGLPLAAETSFMERYSK